MDKKSIYAFILIGIVLVMWMLWMESVRTVPAPEVDTTSYQETEAILDTSTADKEQAITETLPPADSSEQDEQAITAAEYKYGKHFSAFAKGEEEFITIETELFIATLSTKGATIVQWELKKYNNWAGAPVRLVATDNRQLYLTFFTVEGNIIDSRDLYFAFSNREKSNFKLSGENTLSIDFKLDLGNNKSLVRTFKFSGNSYDMETDVALNNLDDIIPRRGFNFIWEDGLRYQEENSVDESQDAKAIAMMNGTFSQIEAKKHSEVVRASYTGTIDYIATKVKYFGAAIVPLPFRSLESTLDLEGERFNAPNSGMYDQYTLALRIPYKGGQQNQSFLIYIGPLDYYPLKKYEFELQEMVNLGWRYGIKQINEYFLLPLFQFIHRFVPNYGITLMIFSIFIKFLLYPLTIQQMKSAQKMKLLAPEMEKIREKYKDDNTKQQREIMSLYTTYGINPAGGCFPMLLQMPILFALWQFLRAVIDLRQEPFIWWIHDLSTPDKIVDFGFSVIGLTHISGLALLMGVTMFFQQKLTITDPRQKSIIYIMPVMFTFLFSYFPSGLNLYYFMFNLLSIGQQLYMNKFAKNRPTLDDLRKAPKKESWLQKKMREAQEVAESQGKTLPGQPKLPGTVNPNKPNQTKYKPSTKKKK